MEYNWEVGMEVLVSSNYRTSIEKIERLTKTQVVLSRDRRYYKDSGREVGGSGWDIEYIRPATESDKKEIRLSKLQLKLSDFNFREIKDLDLLESIYSQLTGKGSK